VGVSREGTGTLGPKIKENERSKSMSENIAKEIFKKLGYEANEEEIKKLHDNIVLLENNGLGKLNQRLLQGGTGIGDTLAEHNFAVELILYSNTNSLEYEPPGLLRPPDFKVQVQNKTFWIQMKNFAALERNNRQDSIQKRIISILEKEPINKFFNCYYSAEFIDNAKTEDVVALSKFISENAKNSIEDKIYLFQKENRTMAKISFLNPKKNELSGLSLLSSGDMDFENVTGFVGEQLKKSISNAAGAFAWDVSENVLNLIAIEADRRKDSNICDAFFGTECVRSHGHRFRRDRLNDGFFENSVFAKKVVGVIVMKRKERSPISSYDKMLYINEAFINRLDDIKNFLPFRKIIDRNMMPEWGKANFELLTVKI